MMWVFPLSASIRTLSESPSSFPISSNSLVVRPQTGTEVCEPPPIPDLLLSLPAHPRILLVWIRPRCRWQPFPRELRRRPTPVFKILEFLSKPFSSPISIKSSISHWGKPPFFIAYIMAGWQPPVVKLLPVFVRLTFKSMVICEWRGSPLPFWIHVFTEVLPDFFRTFPKAFPSVHRNPIQISTWSVWIKARFLQWQPPEKVNIAKYIYISF